MLDISPRYESIRVDDYTAFIADVPASYPALGCGCFLSVVHAMADAKFEKQLLNREAFEER
jgi:hypothetical protein